MRKLHMGMVGGGIGSFIGDVHRKAAAIDGMIELVCGAFSSNAERSKASGRELFLPEERCYSTFEEMILREKELPEGERMDFVSIVTPNHMHFAPAKMALEHGFPVVCDKPIAFDLEESRVLEKLVQETQLPFALTHNYTGYPMVKQARLMVAHDDIGTIRKVSVQYHQGWLSTDLEASGQKQASWRTDPKRSGVAGALGDIGTHAENLACYITGLEIEELAADLSTFVKGRLLDDDANVLLRFKGGAKGTLSASQVAAGEENSLSIKVYGEIGSLEWHQMEPNTLIVRWLDRPTQHMRTDGPGLYPEVAESIRIPAGHPEGYLEGFANIYKQFAKHLWAFKLGEVVEAIDHPSVSDGVKGMQFIYAAVESSQQNAAWVKMFSVATNTK